MLRLWREKEDEVEGLRGEVDGLREGLEGERGWKRRKTSSVGVGVGGWNAGPDTPPEEGEGVEFVAPSFVGEVRVSTF